MGFFDKLKEGLKKTRANFTDSMDQIFNSYEKVDEDFYEELEEKLILADLGMQPAMDAVEELRQRVYKGGRYVDVTAWSLLAGEMK